MGKLFPSGFLGERGLQTLCYAYAMLCYVNRGKHGEAVSHWFSRGGALQTLMLCYAM